MRVLSDHGLVEVDNSSQELIESRGYSIHGYVYLWTVHVLNQEWDYNLARVAVKSVGLHIPGQQAARPGLRQRRLFQHAARCSHTVLNGMVMGDDMPWVYHNLGDIHADQGKLADAERMYERALQGKEKAWGPEYISTVDTVNNLGIVYGKQGKIAKAEQMFERALCGCEKEWGPEHTSTLDTVNNLGILYKNQGRLAEAEQMYERALLGYEKARGPEHTSTLTTVGNLGNLYKTQGKLAEAEQMYTRALKGYEKAWGPEHTSTLTTVNNLGIFYTNQGKLVEAEQMFEWVLRGCENALGTDNITTYIPALKAIWGLGYVSEFRDDLVRAKTVYSKALIGYGKLVGPDHVWAQSLRNNIQALDNFMATTPKTPGIEELMGNSQGKWT